MRTFTWFIVGVAVAAAAYSLAPDIQRYLKIRDM